MKTLSVILVRAYRERVCTFVSLTLDNILQQYVPRNTVAKFFPNCSLLLISLDYYDPSVLANETLSVSICRETDNIFGAVQTCLDHVLSFQVFRSSVFYF